jgi:CheY-like chemotaxis protein
MPTTNVQPKHILIIEDDEGLSKFLQMLLQRKGYLVDVAPDGAAGLARCQAAPYDAVLVDYIMPVMDGLEVLRYAAANPHLPPMILMTGSGNEAVAVEAMKLGAADYIVKDSGKCASTGAGRFDDARHASQRNFSIDRHQRAAVNCFAGKRHIAAP